jgi:4-aminobutyrate aminotransferase
MQRLSTWPQKHAIVGDVRGRGLMIGVEIVKDKEAKTPDPETRDRIVEAAFERGILFLGAGPNSIRISPPLIVTREEADVAMEILEECIASAEKR